MMEIKLTVLPTPLITTEFVEALFKEKTELRRRVALPDPLVTDSEQNNNALYPITKTFDVRSHASRKSEFRR